MENDPIDIGFVCRSMVSASMPHSRVKGDKYRRKSHNFTLEITGNDDAGGFHMERTHVLFYLGLPVKLFDLENEK